MDVRPVPDPLGVPETGLLKGALPVKPEILTEDPAAVLGRLLNLLGLSAIIGGLRVEIIGTGLKKQTVDEITTRDLPGDQMDQTTGNE